MNRYLLTNIIGNGDVIGIIYDYIYRTPKGKKAIHNKLHYYIKEKKKTLGECPIRVLDYVISRKIDFYKEYFNNANRIFVRVLQIPRCKSKIESGNYCECKGYVRIIKKSNSYYCANCDNLILIT